MLDLLIFADDFTGALDTGVKFSSRNIKTLVTSDIKFNIERLESDVKVLVINTETRHLSNQQAYDRIIDLLNSIERSRYRKFYKKIDSAFRGNISSEIMALRDFFDFELISVAGAYPDMNRVIRNGILYIDDKPVDESVFSKDPLDPSDESEVKKIINKGNDLYIKNIYELPLVDELDMCDVLVFDCVTNQDLDEIYSELEKSDNLMVTVGCAGFAETIAKNVQKEYICEKCEDIKYPIAILSGSLNPITLKQIEKFRESGEVISVLNREYIENIEEDIHKNLVDSETKKIVFETFDFNRVKESSIDTNEISDILGILTKKLFAQGFRSFMFIGGDTLYGIMKVLGISEIEPIDEVYTGVVESKIEIENEEVLIISKSGGFGKEDLLINI